MKPIFVPNILVSGEPGSGKSYGITHYALAHKGALFSGDPHERSTTRLLLEHATGNVLYHNIGDDAHSLGYGFLKPPPASLPRDVRAKLAHRKAKQFTEILMSRRGGNIASTPLIEEYTLGLLMLFLSQDPPKDPSIVPCGLLPGTPEFRALLRDCPLPDVRHKFQQLDGLSPRALRTEVGSTARLIESFFREDAFVAACRWSPHFELGRFIQDGGWLLFERGKADRDVAAVIIRGITRLYADHCESRPEPYPPVVCILDECTNVGTAKEAEQHIAAEDRKYGGPHMWFIVQYPNFYDPEAFFQVCQEFHAYKCADEGYARKQAKKIAAAMGDFSQVDRITSELLRFKVGQRYRVGRDGVHLEEVPPLQSKWPSWKLPDGRTLADVKLEEKLCKIYQRSEYRSPSGSAAATASGNSSPGTTPPSSKSPGIPSAVEEMLKRRRQAGTSHGNAGGESSTSSG